MFIINVLLLVALTFVGLLCILAGMEGWGGHLRFQSLSLFLALLNLYAPHLQARVEPAILRIESMGWLVFGALLTGLGIYGLWLILTP